MKGRTMMRKYLLATATLLALLLPGALRADTNEVPHLRPPHPEIPPKFLEQYGVWIMLMGVAVGGLASAAIWLLARPEPEVVIPPAVQARLALADLTAEAAEGATLSRIGQILRRYVRQTFDLPPEEVTTTEFCGLIARQPHIGPELAGTLTEFFQENDRRKFSADADTPTASNATAQALAIIDRCEARRAASAAAAPAVNPPA